MSKKRIRARTERFREEWKGLRDALASWELFANSEHELHIQGERKMTYVFLSEKKTIRVEIQFLDDGSLSEVFGACVLLPSLPGAPVADLTPNAHAQLFPERVSRELIVTERSSTRERRLMPIDIVHAVLSRQERELKCAYVVSTPGASIEMNFCSGRLSMKGRDPLLDLILVLQPFPKLLRQLGRAHVINRRATRVLPR